MLFVLSVMAGVFASIGLFYCIVLIINGVKRYNKKKLINTHQDGGLLSGISKENLLKFMETIYGISLEGYLKNVPDEVVIQSIMEEKQRLIASQKNGK